jgi:hypothetical protein
MANLQLQPSIATDLRSQAHLELIDRLSNLDLTPILVYRIASLVDSAVLAMAWQWDVLNPLLLPEVSQLVTLSYASWDVVQNIGPLTNVDLLQYQAQQTESAPLAVLYAQYRALILLSTSLHSVMGTPAALQKGLTNLGYPNAVIQEGQSTWGGTGYPADQAWAVFRVLINLATVPADTDITALTTRVTAICNYWKPARCVLDSVQFQLYLEDALSPAPSDFILSAFSQMDTIAPQPSDLITARARPLSDTKAIVLFHKAEYYRSNSVTYGSTQPAVADGPMVMNGTAAEG